MRINSFHLFILFLFFLLQQPLTLKADHVNLSVEAPNARLITKAMTSVDWDHALTYQGNGDKIRVVLNLSYTGQASFSLLDVFYADSPAWQGPAELLPSFEVTGNSIAFDVDLSKLDYHEYQSAQSYRPYLPMILSMRVSIEDNAPITIGVRLVFYPKQVTEINYIAADAKLGVGVYEVSLTPDESKQPGGGVRIDRVAVTNAVVIPATLNEKLSFVPESRTTRDRTGGGTMGFAYFDVVANTESSGTSRSISDIGNQRRDASQSDSDPSKVEDTLGVSVSSEMKEQVRTGGTIWRPYTVVSAVENLVFSKGPLGGDYVPVRLGDRLSPGSMLMLKITRDYTGTRLLKPYIKLDFYDNSSGEMELVNQFENDFDKSLYIKIGERGVADVAAATLITDIGNFAKTVAENPRDYARVTISWGIGKGVAVLTAGKSWVLGQILGYGARKLILKTTDPGRTRSSLRTGPVTQRMGQGTAYYIETILRNQEVVVYNKGADLLLEDGVTTTIIPERSWVGYSSSGSISSPRSIFPYSSIPTIPVSLSPAGGESVNSLYHCLETSFSGYSLPGNPEPIVASLKARLNGKLISPFMRVDTDIMKAFYCPPFDEPLKEGANIFRAAISTKNGGRSLSESSFQAFAAIPAQPQNVEVVEGAAKLMLFWDRSKENYVSSYKIFRAVSDSSGGVEIGSTSQPVYVVPASEMGGYYFIRACDSQSRCSSESLRVEGSLDSSSISEVPVISAVSALVSEDNIKIMPKMGSPVPLAWILRKAESESGSYKNILEGEALIRASSYTVTGLDKGKSYWFQALPIGRDLVEGAAVKIGPFRFEDVAPLAPAGVSVEFEKGAARVEWNPSEAGDVIGYYLYRSINEGSFERIGGGEPIIDSFFSDWVESDQRISWQVMAVDSEGRTSAGSEIVYASTWGLGYLGVDETGDTFIISAIAGEGGQIEPSGAVSVAKGDSRKFIISPDDGYRIDFIVVDGEKISLTDEYVFPDVIASHNMAVSFKKKSEEAVIISPDRIDFKKLAVGKLRSKRIKIKNNTEKAIKLRSFKIVSEDKKSFRIKLKKSVRIAKGKKVFVRVVFRPRSKGLKQGLLIPRFKGDVTAGEVILKGKGKKSKKK